MCNLLVLLSFSSCRVAGIGITKATASAPSTPTTRSAPLAAPAPTLQAPLVATSVVGGMLPGDGSPTQAAAATEGARTGSWQTYRSDQAGYTVEYPNGWIVDEQVGTRGTARSVVTTFRPRSNSPLLIISTKLRVPDQAEPTVMPNTRCQQMQGNQGIATHCLDTISGAASATIVAQGKTYTIATAGKGMDQSIYQHFLDSFAPLAPPASQIETTLEPLLFQSGDLPTGVSARHADDPSLPNFVDDPPAATIVGATFVRDSGGAGRVSLLLYTAPVDLESAYKRLIASVLRDEATAGNQAQPKPKVGEKAVATRLTTLSSTYGKGNVSVIIFTRCHTLVDIRLNEWTGMTLDIALAYARRLDARLLAQCVI